MGISNVHCLWTWWLCSAIMANSDGQTSLLLLRESSFKSNQNPMAIYWQWVPWFMKCIDERSLGHLAAVLYVRTRGQNIKDERDLKGSLNNLIGPTKSCDNKPSPLQTLPNQATFAEPWKDLAFSCSLTTFLGPSLKQKKRPWSNVRNVVWYKPKKAQFPLD